MRTVIKDVSLVVLLCSLLCGCRQSTGSIELSAGTEKDIAAILKRQEEFPEAHSFEDGTKLAEFFTDDALLMPPDEPIVHGKQAIAEWYERELKKAAPIENPKVIIEEIEVFGNLAFNRRNLILKFEGETADKPVIRNLRFITIWQKQPDGSWKFYRDIWNTNASVESLQ